MKFFEISFFLILALVCKVSFADDDLKCLDKEEIFLKETNAFKGVAKSLVKKSSTIFKTINEAIEVRTALETPVKYIETGFKKIPKFPSFSQCKQSFFRVAVIGNNIDETITEEGWKSGWARKADELKKQGIEPNEQYFDAIPPTRPLEDRIVEYVRVKNVYGPFPKNSSVVGVLENPIRTMSVGYHTGYNSGISGDHMRMDEIEVGPCAKAPECKSLTPMDSTEVFKKRKLIPRYTTEGEWAVDTHIPASCIVATYRTVFYKVDDTYYSDVNGNTSGGNIK